MHTPSTLLNALLASGALAILLCLGPVPTVEADSLDELRERFAERYPELARAKRDGIIGETWEGTVAVVSGSADEEIRDLLREENADRRTLYRIIAQREETTPEHVARRNARRNFDRANGNEYLRDREGNWYRKRDRENDD